MPKSLIPSFLLYVYITAITPGPANLCSLATALQYGTRPALKQWRGLFFGFFIDSMVAVLVNFFIGAALNQYVGALSFIGAAYILWMVWHMLKDPGEENEKKRVEPSFLTGLLVQLTNVKVMVCCLTTLSCYVLPYDTSFLGLLRVGLFLPFTGPIANLIWLFAGAFMQNLFRNYKRQVNIVMAVSLSLCAVSLVWPK